MVGTITISARAIGRRKRLLDDWSIPIPPVLSRGEPFTLRDLITRVVVETVEAFRNRQEENRFIRVLTERAIREQAARGKVDSGGRDLDQQVEVDEAIDNALVSFEDGLYLVIVDDQEYRDLDAEVHMKPDSRVTFLRLVMLAGG